jgi:pseudaminic acid cytidylyltransferase
MRLAIITARGGSKRIPRKNIRDFCGKPIIAYSIEAALASKCFDEVMVSTDDQEIADIAQQYGAKVPFMRSAKNSDDHATTAEVIHEVLCGYQALAKEPQFACCLYPTAPFVTASVLNEAMTCLQASPETQSVVPVVRFSFPIQRALKIVNNQLAFMQPKHALTRSQDLEPAYHDAGQFYCLNVASFMQDSRLFSDKTKAVILPEWQVQDIDNEDDWILAEMKYKFLHTKMNEQSQQIAGAL